MQIQMPMEIMSNDYVKYFILMDFLVSYSRFMYIINVDDIYYVVIINPIGPFTPNMIHPLIQIQL
jgi:hypothetical protein